MSELRTLILLLRSGCFMVVSVNISYRLTGVEEVPVSEGPLSVDSFLPLRTHTAPPPAKLDEFGRNPLKRSSVLEPPDSYMKVSVATLHDFKLFLHS